MCNCVSVAFGVGRVSAAMRSMAPCRIGMPDLKLNGRVSGLQETDGGQERAEWTVTMVYVSGGFANWRRGKIVVARGKLCRIR